tara:strand:- start:227 stop:1894 length:1668 start_codon:yes stop_codon:yes gene_type:complete
MELIKFIITYSILTLSIIGYGFFFCNYFTRFNNINLSNISIGYIGLFGIFFLIFISYSTNIFFAHSNYHNLIIHLIGILSFSFFFKKNYKKIRLKYFFLAYLISFFAIFYFKSHDDFSYYHFSFIENITRNKIEFGLGHFDTAFNHVSSLFYFHSLFKTTLTSHFFYQIGQLSIAIFVNTILFENIFVKKKSSKLDITFYLSIFCIFFINIFFYRLAEHGTDRSAQILFFLCIILIISIFKNTKYLDEILEKLLIIFTLIVSIKSFYLLYSLILLIIYFKFYKVNYLFNFFKKFNVTKICIAMLIFIMIYSMSHSGCFLYPVSFTCPSTFFWGYEKEKILGFMNWYELWSKAGATPNFRVDDISHYLKGLNWVPNWIDTYFFNKILDFISGILFMMFIILLFFKPKKLSFKGFGKFFIIYILLMILFLEWFFNHPSLRYGGYVLIFLLITIPISILLENQNFKFSEKFSSIKIIFLIGIFIFAGRNINRLNNEYKIYNYTFYKNPYYRIQDKFFYMQNTKGKLFKKPDYCERKNIQSNLNCIKKNSYNFYYFIDN